VAVTFPIIMNFQCLHNKCHIILFILNIKIQSRLSRFFGSHLIHNPPTLVFCSAKLKLSECGPRSLKWILLRLSAVLFGSGYMQDMPDELDNLDELVEWDMLAGWNVLCAGYAGYLDLSFVPRCTPLEQ